jgi:aminoglycoside/choline kinase family phosphotransferase
MSEAAEDSAREIALDELLGACGWRDAERHPLTGDASFRRYVRLQRGADSAMVMDAPPPRENVRPWLAVAELLRRLGLRAPAVLAADIEHGFLLIEDFGDRTFTRALAAGADEAALYASAIDLLIALHRQDAGQQGLPPYDRDLYVLELGLFTDWYLPAVLPAKLPAALADEYRAIWQDLLALVDRLPETLVHRDYHVDNLMLLDDGTIGLIDFQDAVRGPTAYDLVSLLKDARRDVDPALSTALAERYLDAFPELDRAQFRAASAILSTQRLLKIIGIFTRLDRRDGKPVYLGHIPRLWRLVAEELRHPVLAPLKAWLDRAVPETARCIPGERVA